MNEQQKQRLFASYWGQVVLSFKHKGRLKFEVNAVNLWGKGVTSQLDDAYLQLTHPSQITDAHAVELFDLVYSDGYNGFTEQYKLNAVKDWINSGYILLNKAEIIISFLRRNGYIFQFEGLSIEELVESGVVELK